jgi:penicillin-binding protein 2
MIDGRVGSRLKLLALLVAFMFAALTVRLWYLQVLASDQFTREANSNGIRFVETAAPRGLILDDKDNVERPLVGNRATIEVLVNRQQLGVEERAVVRRLSKLLGIPERKIEAKLADKAYYPYQPVPIAVDVNKKVTFAIGEHRQMFPGVSTQETAIRTYPNGDLAAHILGYTGPITAENLKDPYFAGYGLNDQVGKDGLEREYDHYLQGRKGVQKYRINAAGENLGPIGEARPPVPGDNVVLNIDAKIQQAAEEALANGIEGAHGEFDTATNQYLHADAGAVVVMDPRTGAIKALASNPTFDPSAFVGGISPGKYKQLQSRRAGDPLFDRAIAGQYPPGSTFKPFVALSAVHDGIASLGGSYACPAEYTVKGDKSGTVFHNWTTANLGYFSLSQALEYSCDTVFYPFGYDYWQKYYPPPSDLSKASEPLQRDLRQFGFGSDTGVDLPTDREKPGFIPTAEWKTRMSKEEPKIFGKYGWVPGDLIQMTIGQGNVLATPLQMATAYSAIANGGKVCVPHLAARVETPAGKLVKKIDPHCRSITPFYTSTQLNYIRNALETVPTGGTAAPAFVGFPLSQYPIAGKTGTAQVPGKQDFSWFASMAPANNPKYVVVAIVEQGGHGSTTAAPIVRNVYESLFGLQTTRFHTAGAND